MVMPAFRTVGQKKSRVEGVHHRDRSAMDQHRGDRHHAAGVKQRQIDHVAVAARQERRRSRHLVEMHIGRHHALRRPCRAGCEDDRLHVPRRDRPLERGRPLVGAVQRARRMDSEAIKRTVSAAKDDDLAHGFARDVIEPRAKVGMGDHQPRLGQGDRMLEQRAAIGGIDRHEHGAEIVEAEPDAQGVGAVRQPDQHALALVHAECA